MISCDLSDVEKFPRKFYRVPPLVAPSAAPSTVFPLHALSFRARGSRFYRRLRAVRENGFPRKCGEHHFLTGADPAIGRRSADRPASPACLQTHVAYLTSNLWHITCSLLTCLPEPSAKSIGTFDRNLSILDSNRSFFLLPIDALHGQWHDGQRYYPGCSWLSPWSSPWGSCWCWPQGLEAMGNSRRRTNGSPRSASPSIVRSLGKKVSTREHQRLDDSSRDAANISIIETLLRASVSIFSERDCKFLDLSRDVN